MSRSAVPFLALAACLFTAAPSHAVIKAKVPLKDVLDKQQMIFVAEVEAVHPGKPAVVFKFAENLKGKAPFQSLTVNLTGDSFAKKDKHTRVMLDRLAPGRKLVLFVDPVADEYAAFGFIEGTWFQMRGTKDGDAVRWAFLHCEPYLRRTFKGTTDDLRTTVVECLAGKRQPPEVDEKEPPGYGPPVEANPERKQGGGSEKKNPVANALGSPGLFAVIPSFVLVGPLALVAAIFPGVFARLAVGMTRWRAFLVVASVNSTLALAYWGLRELAWLPDSRWASPPAVACYLLAITAVGLVWAGRRYRRLAADDPDVTSPPGRGELFALLGLTAALWLTVAGVVYFLDWGEALSLAGTPTAAGQPASGMGKEFTAIAVGLIVATLYAGYRAITCCDPGPVRLSLSGESVGLGAMVLFGAFALVLAWPREKGSATLHGELGETTDATVAPKLADVRVWFETSDLAEVMSPVVVAGDRVYFGARKEHGLYIRGAVVCLDRVTGREVWRFNDGGKLMPVFAAPAVSGGHVFAGEGLHTDADRRLFRLDAASGKPSWPKPVATTSHTEGAPRVVDGKVYFAAGDDGVYCVNAVDGAAVWHFQGDEQKLHIDTSLAVANGRVFAGSGYRTLALLGLDAATGTEVWRTPVGLRSFGPPLVLGDRVVYGLGTGNLVEELSTEAEEGVPPETAPAGAVVCVEAATGAVVWRYDTPKSVHTALVADARSVYAACKDGSVYALERATGKLRWRRSLGSALTAGPAVATYAGGALTLAVYVVSREGLAACLNPADGGIYWTRDLGVQTGREVQVFSTPVVLSLGDGARRELLFGAMLTGRNTGARYAAVFRIEDVVE
ncbi:MAG TPA: PQQ-binding-like beta-propeller repeat protein [Fimbriiglobus sp.]|jgi:outer membrane protein assembly factor BamB|nr:PQQ-binding-like beta-propeller repeat protein [Fimbriiglobus sp.]